MKESNWVGLGASVLCFASYAAVASGQMMSATIIDRKNRETKYTYVVPGQFSSHSNTDLGCTGDSTSLNCSGSTTTAGVSSPSAVVSYAVEGATLSLLLPDGRVAVVNCAVKQKLNAMGLATLSQPTSPRSCRVPFLSNIQVDFKGKGAKLIWPVSLDGKKTESETYKIVAILNR
jgi:hypothetical protein